MGKVAKTNRGTTVEGDPTEVYLAALEAKQQFLGAVLNMGWRLAVTFLIPVLIGAWLDKRYDQAPSYTITAIFIAIFGSVMVVWNTVKDVNAATAEAEKKVKKRGYAKRT